MNRLRHTAAFALATIAIGVMPAAAAAQAPAPSAPPEVLASPAATVTEKDRITFRIKASAGDQGLGRWAVLIESGNSEVVELRQTSKRTVYERSFRLRNQKVFAAFRDDFSPDFAAPETSSRIFPGTVTWRVAFFSESKHTQTGDRRTRTPKRTFEFEPTFEQRRHVGEPGLPTPRSRRIVPNASLAGISLGDRRAHVLDLWGSPFFSDESLFERTDVWARGDLANGDPRTKGDYAGVEYDQEEVDLIELISTGEIPRRLQRLKTRKGIGLGSTRRAVVRAYPNIEPLESDDGGPVALVLPGRGLSETVFGFTRKGRVDHVLMR